MSGLRPFYCPVELRFCVRPHSDIGVQFIPIFACWDNAVAESFFHSLKTELIHHEKFLTRKQASEKIFEYIEIFYNRQRLHSSNGYLSPTEFEDKMLHLEMVS